MNGITRAAFASMALTMVLTFTLCGCAATQNQTSEEAAAAATTTATTPEAPKTISVKVVDKTRESIPGYDLNSCWLETSYEYDDAGKLVGTSQSSNCADPYALNLCKGTFEYDDAGRLTKVSNAYEQYEWNVANVETYSYDDQGLCTEYTYDVVSQGYGSTKLTYSYDSGHIAQAVESDSDGPSAESTDFDLSWSYLDDGHIAKVISGVGGDAGLGLVNELSDTTQGTYVYRDVHDTLTTVKYNDDGTLASISTRSGNGNYQAQKTFEYKTITVDASEYLPNIYSNPTGLDPKWKPQVSLDEVPCEAADR